MAYTGRHPSRIQRAIEREFGKPWAEVLDTLLLDKRMTQEQAARRLGVSRSTLATWEMWRRSKRAEADAATNAA